MIQRLLQWLDRPRKAESRERDEKNCLGTKSEAVQEHQPLEMEHQPPGMLPSAVWHLRVSPG